MSDAVNDRACTESLHIAGAKLTPVAREGFRPGLHRMEAEHQGTAHAYVRRCLDCNSGCSYANIAPEQAKILLCTGLSVIPNTTTCWCEHEIFHLTLHGEVAGQEGPLGYPLRVGRGASVARLRGLVNVLRPLNEAPRKDK